MKRASNPLTGRKVFLMILGAFAVIIGANLALVFSALGTFPGLETANSYVASQHFDADRAAQDRLGWTATAGYDGETLTLNLKTPDGVSAVIAGIDATIGRATFDRADRALEFKGIRSPFTVPARLGAGKWELRFVATASDGTRFRHRLPIWVK